MKKISKTKLRKDLMSILQLVESKNFPASRCITDYVCSLLGEFDYSLYEWANKICEDYYSKRKITYEPKH